MVRRMQLIRHRCLQKGKSSVPCRPTGMIKCPGLTARRSSKIDVNPPGRAENKLLIEDLVFTLSSIFTLGFYLCLLRGKGSPNLICTTWAVNETLNCRDSFFIFFKGLRFLLVRLVGAGYCSWHSYSPVPCIFVQSYQLNIDQSPPRRRPANASHPATRPELKS